VARRRAQNAELAARSEREIPVSESRAAATATHAAAGHAQAGDVAAARRALGEALTADPGYEPAWRWLASLVTEDAERKFCWQRALAANPTSEARRRLRALRHVTPAPPAEVGWLADPPAPPPPAEPEPLVARRHWRWIAVGLVAVVLLGAGAVWLGGRGNDLEPVHLAFVAGGSSDEARTVRTMLDAVNLVLDDVNDSGGIGGHPVELLVHDDANQPEQARERAEEIVADGRARAVIGHMTTDTSLSAAPVYEAAGLPAITPTATSDELVASSPWFLRTVFGNRAQSEFAAAYLGSVLGVRRVSVLSEDSEYGRDIRDGFVRAFAAHGAIAHDLTVGAAGATSAVGTAGQRGNTTVEQAVETLKADPDRGPVMVAFQEGPGLDVVGRLREAGVDGPVFAGDSMSDDAFHQALAERTARGDTSIGEFYAMSPLVGDAVTGSALRWSNTFRDRYGYRPTWHAATAYDAAVLAVHALRQPGMRLDADGTADDRRRIRDVIAGLDDPAEPVDGVLGPIRVVDRSAVRQVSVAKSGGKRFVSASVQYVDYVPRTADAAAADLQAGRAVEVGGRLLARRQIVSTGINVNEVRDLDTRDGTFFADFFLWLKYVGDDTAADVAFLNSVRPDLTPGEEIRSARHGDTTYKLYRVAEKFKADLDFRAFPFDEQTVGIMLQNRELPTEHVVYVTDQAVLDQSQEERLRNGADAAASIDRIPNWQAENLYFFRETVGTSDELGDPTTAAGSGTYYSQYVAEVRVTREIGPFLAKNLLPLALLVVITYIGLYFPADSGVPFSIAITAILSSAVLLAAVTSPLPSVSYTVAIEWAYYAFITLAALVMLTLLLRQQLSARRRDDLAHRLGPATRIGYPVVIAGIVTAYVVMFG
jgi:ABC-type branched-subunit amino acid transport system substrate-binding protein